MFKLLTLTCVSIVALGIAPVIAETGKYTQEQIDQMPRFSKIERQRCSKALYPFIKKRLECKREVRIETFEKRQARKD